jgi:hypothetical protein
MEQPAWIRQAPVLLAGHVAQGYAEAHTVSTKEESPVAVAPKRCARGSGRELFFDDFNGPNLNSVWRGPLPDAPYRYQS